MTNLVPSYSVGTGNLRRVILVGDRRGPVRPLLPETKRPLPNSQSTARSAVEEEVGKEEQFVPKREGTEGGGEGEGMEGKTMTPMEGKGEGTEGGGEGMGVGSGVRVG